MASKPDTWMPLYIADYLRKTMHLTREQHGGYLLLIMACWDRGGRLPNDPGQLAGIARATPAEWKKLAPVLLPFFDVDGDYLLQDRVIEEHQKAQRLSETRRAAGQQGGRPRKETESKTESEQKPNGFANGKQNPQQNETPACVALPSPKNPPIGEDLDADASLSDRADPPPAAPRRLQPTKAELDGIWEITPRLARERSSRKDLERSLTAAMRRGHDPSDIRAGLVTAYASTSFAGDHAKGVHRLIENDRWRSFTEEISSVVVAIDPERQAEIRRRMKALAEERAESA